MPEIVFGVESYVSRSLPLSAQRVVNAFMERQPHGTKNQTPVFGAPGLTRWIELPTKPLRGFWNFNGVLYAVAGQVLYRINNAGGYKALGGGITGSGVVSISDNGTQIMVVNGVGGYLADGTDNYQQIQNPNFFSASTILFFDNYFAFDRKGTNEWFLSGLSDGTSYSGLDFASAEAQPGFLTALAQNLRLMFLFCQNHIEMWYDVGAQDFPFQPYAGGVIEKGCVSPHSVINQDEALFFLGRDKVFYRLQGNVPQRISTHAVETAIASYGDVSDAFCLTYTLEGHKMVTLTFPSVPHTWEYDISTGLWHERESWDENGNNLGRWRANCAIEIYDKILIGDAFSGVISILDWSVNNELGNTLQMLIHSSTLHDERLPLFVQRLELDMQVGGKFGSGPVLYGHAQPPQAMLRWSKDGGQTWSRRQRWRSLGRVGEYLKRLRWMQIGSARQWVFELTVSDDVPRVLLGAYVTAEPGME